MRGLPHRNWLRLYMWLVRLRLGILEMEAQEVVLLDRDMDSIMIMIMMGEMVEWGLLGDCRLTVRDSLAYGTPCRSTNEIYAVQS